MLHGSPGLKETATTHIIFSPTTVAPLTNRGLMYPALCTRLQNQLATAYTGSNGVSWFQQGHIHFSGEEIDRKLGSGYVRREK